MTLFHYASTTDADMRYLLQYHVSDPVFFLEHNGERSVFLSVLDIEAYQSESNSTVSAIPLDSYLQEAKATAKDSVLSALASTILQKHNINEPVMIPPQFPTELADALRAAGYTLSVSNPWLPERATKTLAEIESIATNTKVVAKAFTLIANRLADSQIKHDELWYDGEPLTSERLRYEIGCYFLAHQLHSPKGMIIAGGPQAALPHCHGHGILRPHEPIIADLFPQSTENHYFADLTRTFVKGTPSKEVKRMYEAVAKAKDAALNTLAPGRPGTESYHAAADVITKAGFTVGDPGFNHALGHGLGVAAHEAPTLSGRSTSTLEVGHVVTIEPGLYYPEHGGVRLEDTVVITENGYRNLTHIDLDWIIP